MQERKKRLKGRFFFGNTVEDVSIEGQGQGTFYENSRSVLKVREES